MRSRADRAVRGLLLLLVSTLLVAACGPGALGGGNPASSARKTSPAPGKPRSTSGSVWILPALGLQVHSQPSPTAPRVATLACGARISKVAQEHANGQDWLHVRGGSGSNSVNGWIVDGPQYEIDRSMSSYSLGGTLTMLYPTTWTVRSGNPALFTAPAGDPAGGTLHLQSAPTASALPNTPMADGAEDTGSETSISLDGIPTEVFVYLTSAGGTEYFIERKLGTLVYLIDLQQAQTPPNTTFFLQLLASVNARFATPSPSPS